LLLQGKCSYPTIKDLRDNYLFGLRLTDAEGNEFPESLYQRNIDAAMRWIQTELQIIIQPTDIIEDHDYYESEYLDWVAITLYEYPVIEVNEIKAHYAGQTITTFPKEWIHLYKESAQIHLVPTAGSMSQILIGKMGAFMPMLFGKMNFVPGLFKVSYKAGFEDGKIPCDIINIAMKKAAIDFLNILGDLILEPGVANFSVSVDGLSQSIGTTASAENNAMSARVRMYQDDIKKDLKDLKAYWLGRRFVAVGG